jgi:hypothetical protein
MSMGRVATLPRAKTRGQELISKAKVALMALFAISASFALDIELLRVAARRKNQSGAGRSEADV